MLILCFCFCLRFLVLGDSFLFLFLSLLCPFLHGDETVSIDGLQNNAQHRKVLVKNIGSYLRAFNPVRPLHFKQWVQRDMQESFTDELNRLRAGRYQFSWKRWFAAQTNPQATVVGGRQYACDRCSAAKRLSTPSLLPTTCTLDECPTNSLVSLRRRRCSSRKAVPSCVCIA